ncbi:MAG TPA: hypothetical protein VFX84_03570 [Candidatus Saccharimonadales bacterium]|nr:hypothetical protein [Candidatus Saccharimonadales bacterium]
MKKKALITTALIGGLIAVGGALEATGTINLVGGKESGSQSGKNGESSDPPPKKPSSSSSGPRQTAPTDTQGSDVPDTESGQWTVSESGLITVKSPAANSVFRSGDTVGGTAKVSKVYLRLVDDKVGVISQGDPIDVIDGKFSAKLRFNAHASTGELDVYSLNSSGAEVNEVQIPVRFQ